MPPLIVAGVVAAGAATASAVEANQKEKAANRMARSAKRKLSKGEQMAEDALKFKEDNKFDIPEAAKESLTTAQNELGSSYLQQSMEQQADQQLAGQVGAVQRTATSSADALAAIQKVYGQSQENYQNAAVAGAQERQGDINNLLQAQAQLSDYSAIQYDQNINMPFLQRMEIAQGKINGGLNAKARAQEAQFQSAGGGARAALSGMQTFASLYGAGGMGGGGGQAGGSTQYNGG